MAHNDKPAIIERVPAQEVLQRTTSLGPEKPVHSIQTAKADDTNSQPIQLDSLTLDQLQDLQSQCQLLERALLKRTQQRDLYKARYQSLATELTKLKSADTGFPQLDDSHLIQVVESLRVKIWNFTLHHFGGPVAPGRGELFRDSLLVYYTERTLRSGMTLECYLKSPDWRPTIIEAFLWKLMVAEVFNSFWWAGDAGRSMRKIHAAVKQSFSSTAADIQTFQTWSATTTKLVHESQKRDGLAWSGSHTKGELKALVGEIYDSIEPYCTSTHGSLRRAIRDILNEAITLDEGLSEQLAQFQWDFPEPQVGDFDADRMRLADGEVAAHPDGPMPVSIIICPGIKKRGRSSGEDFEKEQLLIPIKVSCAPPLNE